MGHDEWERVCRKRLNEWANYGLAYLTNGHYHPMNSTTELPTISVETARALLRHVMEWDSEESTCAGWISGNEYRLWCQVVRDPVVAGEVDDLPVYTWLRELAAAAGGWWVWPHPSPPGGPWFLTMADWLPIYEEDRRKMMEKYGPEGLAAGLPKAREETRIFLETLRNKAAARNPGTGSKP